MSKPRADVSPARSQGAADVSATRLRRTSGRRALSAASPSARSGAGDSPRLSSIIDKFINNDKFAMSPLKRRSVLPDDTEIEAPRRASWWKRLEGSSRDVLEALDTNKMPNNLLEEEYEFEVEKDNQNQTMPESSDNESVASIVVPQRRLFNQKKQPQAKFGEIMGSRKSLGRTNIEDVSIEDAPKNLFNKGPRKRPVFPAALLNSTNKTINKTVEPETGKQTRPNLFGQAGAKRKNMFTDFVLSDSEEDSEIQHKVFGFKKNENKRMSLGTRSRMPSLTPSMTTEIDIDDWNLLPSSTMLDNGIGNPDISRITDKDILQDDNENKDITLTEENVTLNHVTNKISNIKNIENKSTNKTRFSKSVILDERKDTTLTNENIEKADARVGLTINNQSPKQEDINTNHQTSLNEPSVEEAMAELHGESIQLCHHNLKSNTDYNKSVKEIIGANDSNMDNEEIEPSPGIQDADNVSHHVGETNKSNNKSLISQKHNTREAIAPDCFAQDNNDSTKDASQKNEDKDVENQDYILDDTSEKNYTEEEIEPSAEEQDIQENSKDSSQESQDEDMDDTDEKEETQKDIEVSTERQETKDAIQEDQGKDTTRDQDKHCSSKEIFNQNQHEEMEKMVWDDNDDVQSNKQVEEQEKGESDQEKILNYEGASKNDSNKNTILKTSAKEDQIQQDDDVIEETPDNSIHDSPDQNRKDLSEVKSPEAVLQNITEDNESFRPIGRSTTFRKSKSVLENVNMRPSLTAIEESTLGSEGSRNSSTEGSGWDSHRTTRKTIRQTFGKDYTPRKSLRALVMEQSAKRQTELYTKNNSAAKNKTVLDVVKAGNASILNKSKNKTFSQDLHKRSPSIMNEAKNKTVLEDVNDQNIRDRRVSELNLTSNQLSRPKSPGLETSTHHVSDPLISEPGLSYHKSIHDINAPETSQQELSNREESINISAHTDGDSCPEISIHASYGQGMSGENSDREVYEEYHAASGLQISNTENAVGANNKGISQVSMRPKSTHDTTDQEMLDYEASDPEKSEEEMSETEELSQDDSNQENIALDDSARASSHHSSEREEDADSDQRESENDSEPEESEQEQLEDESQLEIESEAEVEESEPESENEQDSSRESVNDAARQESDRESAGEVADDPEISDEDVNNDEDSDHSVSGLNSQYHMSNSNHTERVVFDAEMSEQAVDYEARAASPSRADSTDSNASLPRLDVSAGAKRSMLLMQMQQIAERNRETREKIREKVQNSLKPCRNFSKLSPPRSRRAPVAPRARRPPPAATAVTSELAADLHYRPPKRFRPNAAPWITDRLYKFLETKLEPRYDYRARVRAEELVRALHGFCRLVRRRDGAPPDAVDDLKREMARLRVVATHHDFYRFFHEFMPREIRVKVNPDVVNQRPLPRGGVFADILPPRASRA